MNIDLEKVKEWLEMKSNDMANYDDEDGWTWGQKFAYEWVYSILTDEEDYNNMLEDLKNE